ncbi:hypothetical protein HPB49_020694 [Dermacentor silvarum]|uniref:Uncharacterized protein n=1 Tax=Dermacentor silvarum TaxID=543639 RepID=A0ACB8DKR0_DERSI|nr:hypothetical protein HPB49_020694 [Dermacentor silvarum]
MPASKRTRQDGYVGGPHSLDSVVETGSQEARSGGSGRAPIEQREQFARRRGHWSDQKSHGGTPPCVFGYGREPAKKKKPVLTNRPAARARTRGAESHPRVDVAYETRATRRRSRATGHVRWVAESVAIVCVKSSDSKEYASGAGLYLSESTWRASGVKVAFGDLNPFPMRVINAKRVQHMQAVKEQLRKLDEIRNSLPTRKVQECSSPVSSDDPSK